jgi:hypothetical protein
MFCDYLFSFIPKAKNMKSGLINQLSL